MSHDSSDRVRYKRLGALGHPKYRIGTDGSFWKKVGDRWDSRKVTQQKSGYCSVCFSDGKGGQTMMYVHRVVLEAFVGPCPEGLECRHLDNNKANNRLDNLCWGTRTENQRDRRRFGTDNAGERNASAKMTENKVKRLRHLYATGDYTYGNLAELFGIARCTVGNIVNRVGWKSVD